uniref:Uncharacterized protein n=1 Tax=Rousettus aegyptiacus TaxID=9407 RepID=A0A7J8GAW6_ROUAE|nr:hypothetical protein HJG63_011602 [Rousettus aegyptiacus]
MCLPVFAFISLKFLWLQMSPLYLLLGQAQRLSPQATVIPGMKPVVSTSFYPPRVPTGDWPLKQAARAAHLDSCSHWHLWHRTGQDYIQLDLMSFWWQKLFLVSSALPEDLFCAGSGLSPDAAIFSHYEQLSSGRTWYPL